MALHDRTYWRDDAGSPAGGGLTLGLPRPGRMVKCLLLANLAVFVAQLVCRYAAKLDLSRYLGATAGAWWQAWRYLTFQFLHSPNTLWHIALNMLGLYMLGTPLEQRWGGWAFLRFYLICGAVGGLAYVLAGVVLLPRWAWAQPIIGASGGVYAIVLACAVLFPHFRLILFIFPVPIRLAALLIFGAMVLGVLSSLGSGQTGPEFWSDVAHLGGAVAGGAWVWLLPRLRGQLAASRERMRRGAWQRNMDRRAAAQAEVDRVLAKVHEQGLASLDEKEKRILRDASQRQREEERTLYRS
ncbi:MAG TPA: hypothetical protein DCX07_12670 [Phycisphaerales bacterium]|nr:hypothetical protein [Phycisphaerales bacterium]